MDTKKVGTKMKAPDRMVNTAMMAAVVAPKVTSGTEPS